jgi:ABC-type uncharacterized transport system substrate-binding protein
MGLIVSPNAVTFSNRDFIVALAARLRLPAIYAFAFYPKSGGLISYGFDPVNHFQHGAGYVDRILRGAKPADLPVQYPTKFQLIVNLKTAKALGHFNQAIQLNPKLVEAYYGRGAVAMAAIMLNHEQSNEKARSRYREQQ